MAEILSAAELDALLGEPEGPKDSGSQPASFRRPVEGGPGGSRRRRICRSLKAGPFGPGTTP